MSYKSKKITSVTSLAELLLVIGEFTVIRMLPFLQIKLNIKYF